MSIVLYVTKLEAFAEVRAPNIFASAIYYHLIIYKILLKFKIKKNMLKNFKISLRVVKINYNWIISKTVSSSTILIKQLATVATLEVDKSMLTLIQ